ncbi:MAG: endonuclease MutS2 [Polyangiaceae bacterium]|nr:endonuclease MutS2 [Polyangiaceae bacterium]
MLDREGARPKARADLELDRITGALAQRCVSEAGSRRAHALPFLTAREDVVRSLGEIDEARKLDDQGEPLPLAAIPDVGEAIGRARLGATLSGEEVRDLTKVLIGARKLRKFLRSQREKAPLLAVSCDTDPELDKLAAELERSFEADGTIADAASERLAELRAELRTSRDRIVRRLEELLAKYASILSDSYWTERDGRYVLPVRADAHERFPGIVHGASSGGATLFVEPRVIVSMGNRHKVLDAMVLQEEEAVLRRLGTLIAESIESVAGAVDALAAADVRRAQAKLAVDLRLITPDIPEGREPGDVRIELIRARHPILQLDGVDVVPSDLSVRAGKVLVMSGPNAGGKTVALKTLGLTALMLRMGMPVPAAEGSMVALVDEVLTDVGDEQSLAKNLSTFSAHVRNLVEILDATHIGSLVLLDEVASGTDPREGEALATAVLESLAARGGAVACTTHYEGLKVLALTDDRFQNASVGFDFEKMEPTFAVVSGVPGASSALAVARRYGVPSHLVERAESFLSHDTLKVSQLVERLAADRRELDTLRDQARREAQILHDKQRDLDAEIERLSSKERGTVQKENEALLTGIKRAREELRAAQARLRATKLDARELADAERSIDKVAATVAIGGPLELPRAAPATVEAAGMKAGELFPGMKVFVPRLRTDAEVLEVLASGQVRVAAGPLKLLASIDEVRRTSSGAKKGTQPASTRSGGGKREAPKQIVLDAAADPDVPLQTSDNTVDLRGLRVHEAVSMAEQFLDRCVGSGKRVAFLIHGHGTGALRQALREALNASSYVDRMRAGEPREGGDGVTVVWLR